MVGGNFCFQLTHTHSFNKDNKNGERKKKKKRSYLLEGVVIGGGLERGEQYQVLTENT